jgi:hypothetical protein
MIINLKKFSSGRIARGLGTCPEENLDFRVLYGGICDHSAAMTVNSTIQFLWDFLKKSDWIYEFMVINLEKYNFSSWRIAWFKHNF